MAEKRQISVINQAVEAAAQCIKDHLSIDPEKGNAFEIGKVHKRRNPKKEALWADIEKKDRRRLADSALKRLTYNTKSEPEFTNLSSAETAGEFQCARYYYRLIIKIRELAAYIDAANKGYADRLHEAIFAKWQEIKSSLE